jgi:hypothetical protein
MRKTKTILGLLATVAVVLAVSAIDASANCIPAKVAGNFDPALGLYAPWIPGAPVNEGTLKGRFWTQGNRSGGNEGALQGFLYFFAGTIYMNANLGDGDVVGCPANRLLTVAQVETLDGGGTRFLAATVDEISGPAFDFQYGNLGSLELVEMPRIQVLSSSRSGSVVTLNFSIPPITGTYGPGADTAIQAVNVLSAAGTADPGRNAAAYTLLQRFPTTAGSPVNGSVTVDCSNTATDRFVVTQIEFDQGVGSDLVSRAVRVECDPTLADPNREFKMIDGPKDKPRPVRER